MIELKNEAKEFVKDASSNISDRLKMPLIIVYICVLITYNWDFLYILFFSKQDEILIVNYLKESESITYPERFFIPLFWSILSTLLFPILQIGLNYLYQGYKNQDIERVYEEIEFRETKKKKINDIRAGNQQVNDLINKINTLENEVITKSNTIEKLNETVSQLQSEIGILKIQLSEFEGSLLVNDKININVNEVFDSLNKLNASLGLASKNAVKRIVSELLEEESYFKFEDFNISKWGSILLPPNLVNKLLIFSLHHKLVEEFEGDNNAKLFKVTPLGRETFREWLEKFPIKK